MVKCFVCDIRKETYIYYRLVRDWSWGSYWFRWQVDNTDLNHRCWAYLYQTGEVTFQNHVRRFETEIHSDWSYKAIAFSTWQVGPQAQVTHTIITYQLYVWFESNVTSLLHFMWQHNGIHQAFNKTLTRVFCHDWSRLTSARTNNMTWCTTMIIGPEQQKQVSKCPCVKVKSVPDQLPSVRVLKNVKALGRRAWHQDTL